MYVLCWMKLFLSLNEKIMDSKIKSVSKESNWNGSDILPYEKKMLLTKTEYGFWKCLKQKCDEKGFIICPKVRMEDFLSVTVKDKSSL